jgi:hypothetical protein
MPIAKVNFSPVNDASTDSGGGGEATWTEISYADSSSNAGNYGFTHSTGSAGSGFAHSITVDTAANSYYLDVTQCASVFFDTGITFAELAAYKSTVIGLSMETSLDNTHAQASDAGAFLNFGLYITDSTTLSSGAIGGWAGIVFLNSLGIRPAAAIGRFTNDTTTGAGVGSWSDYNYSGGQVFKGLFLDSSIRLGTSTDSGPQGISVGYQYEPTGGSLAGDRYMNQRSTTPVGTGNVVLGAMFGQRVVGAGQSKTMDFNLYYSIVSRS